MEEHEARSHLEELADELSNRGWHATVRDLKRGVILEVANPEVPSPDDPPLRETIACTDLGDGDRRYTITGGQAIGRVSEVPATADQIQHVLRSVGS